MSRLSSDQLHCLGSQPSRAAKGNTAAQKVQAVDGADAAQANGAADSTPAEKVSKADVSTAFKQLNDHLSTIYESLPKNTAFIVLSGHSDPRTVTALTAKKNRFDLLYKTGTPLSTMADEDKWMEADDRALLSAVHRVRDGMTFLAIKR